MNTEAVFFDLDGTLIDTAPDMGGALNTVLQAHGRKPVAEALYRPQVSHGSLALLKLGFPELDSNKDLGELRTEFLQTYEQDIAVNSALFNGMETVLSSLESHHIPWGIITNKPEYLTLKLLDHLALTKRCCSIVGADTTTHAKPHPAPMLLACEQSGVDPVNCLYVGDALRDIQAGQAVNMKSLIAGWGYISAQDDDTSGWHADAFLESPLEILTHLQPEIIPRLPTDNR